MKHLIGMLLALPACAQDGTVTLEWSVTTDDGDALVEAGEAATVSLSADMSPDVDLEHVLAFGAIAFNCMGNVEASNGRITGWEMNWWLANITGDTTTTDGVNLFNTQAMQLSIVGLSYADPIHLLSFTWAPDVQESYTVQYTTYSWNPFYVEPPRHVAAVWLGPANNEGIAEWDVEEAVVSFEVADPCYADLNDDGSLDVLDFVAFQLAWLGGDDEGDCDDDGAFDVLDFACFQAFFAIGCE